MGKLDETEEEKKRFSKVKDMYKPLTDWWKKKLTDLTEGGAMKDAGVKVEKVEISKRLTDSPVVVVTSQFGYSAHKEDKAAKDTAQVLFQTALIESGYEIADPSALVSRVYKLMSKELGVDPEAPLKEVEVPEEEEEEAEEEEESEESEEEDEKPDKEEL